LWNDPRTKPLIAQALLTKYPQAAPIIKAFIPARRGASTT